MKTPTAKTRRHFIVPDTQVRVGIPTEHLEWCGQAIADYKPDTVIHLGDHFDMPSLSKYESPGSAGMEGKRILEDINAGNEAFAKLVAPMHKEMARSKRSKNPWMPECHFLLGNHEHRITRAAQENPKLDGLLTLDSLKIPAPFVRHPFLEIVELDGIAYSHFFSATHSGRALGGSIEARLNRIGRSFCQGHQQGLLYGIRQFPGKLTRHGIVAGSFYAHDEPYRDAQSNGEWRGVIVLNEVADGNFCIMPLTLTYLQKKYG